MTAIEVRDLRIELSRTREEIVDGISFAVEAGEIVGLVGESGSGKTTIGTALLAHASRGARIAEGRITIDGTDMLGQPEARLERLRGGRVAYVPQDPGAALNPALRIGGQLDELLRIHEPQLAAGQRRERVRVALEEVKLPAGGEMLARFPHQISGGQAQRVVLAMAFITRPAAIVLDEPTTGLDVTTQAHILATLRELCRAHRVATIYVSHDLAVVKQLADRVIVVYAGRIVEMAATGTLFAQPAHPYTRGLLGAIPDIARRRVLTTIDGQAPRPGARPAGCSFAPRCEHATEDCRAAEPDLAPFAHGHDVRCIRVAELAAARPAATPLDAPRSDRETGATMLSVAGLDAHYGKFHVLRDITFDVPARSCVALVGESGSGKTTLSRCLIGLMGAWRGDVRLDDRPLAPRARARDDEQRRRMQYVFQNPYRSLNPRLTVGESIARPIRRLLDARGAEVRERVRDALELVSLPGSCAERMPRELSGGERQRVAIARALVCEPELLICDEVTSALDVSVQAAIIKLLQQLQRERGLTMLFVTHDLAVVRQIADRVIVMNRGAIVESGDAEAILDEPGEEYTRSLVADSPSLEHDVLTTEPP